MPHRIVILGLSITSSWGNGHATIFRALVRALHRRGHHVTFLERNVPWYSGDHRDQPAPEGCDVVLYDDPADLDAHRDLLHEADMTMVGSYVPDGIDVGNFVLNHARRPVFYDIDTPVTLARLRAAAAGDAPPCEYLSPRQIPDYHTYFTFTGGPTLDRLENRWGSPHAEPLYCCVDPERYTPDPAVAPDLDLGYLGTYSDDRQPKVERLLLLPAAAMLDRRFALVGPMYPDTMQLTGNIERVEHLPPPEHRRFYNRQRWTLNITRADMVEAGYAPSVRLFEAAACGTPIISDPWPGLDTFFPLGTHLLTADSSEKVEEILRDVPEQRRLDIAERGRRTVLEHHTADARAAQLERWIADRAAPGAPAPDAAGAAPARA